MSTAAGFLSMTVCKVRGGVPWGGLTFDAVGNLYGTTFGGPGTVAYYGTVFELTW
ncbi:MAG: hypothetical protein WB538_02330 [Candidatus Sulfotelmatobacter sp.]